MNAAQQNIIDKMARLRADVLADEHRIKNNYISTIAALTIVLEMLERKMTKIRDSDKRSHHTATLGHIRSALSYERKVLSELTDPQGMASMTEAALEKLLTTPPSNAVALLEEEK